MFKCFLLIFAFITSSYAAELHLLPAESVHVQSSVKRGSDYKHQAPVLLISCVDYRFPDEIADFMQKRGALDKYAHLIVAGGSIGIDNLLYPDLRASFITQMRLLKDLYNFHTIILLDHRDCDLFKLIHGDKHTNNPADEEDMHKHHLHNVKKLILEIYPDMNVEMLLMAVDGSVITIK
ncbi:MAG: hypothetical protein V4485_04235 [Pseudomonadota bacterium]